MPDIVLATLNARYIHASFGLRCLRANLGELRAQSALAEFTISQRPLEIAEKLLALQPRILGLGVYIWNVAPATELVALLKRLRPELIIVLGGPEVSYECEQQEIVRLADHVITGEGDLRFQELCRQVLSGCPPAAKIIPAAPPDVARLALPYDEYTDDDIAHRLVYVEASRGCPFECEFCLSSLDIPVRAFPLDAFLPAMDRLIARGVRHFKFVDRTFNLHLETGRRILEFFLARLQPGLFLHFEMIPDRLPAGLRERVSRFPLGSLQFEVGVQTFNPGVAAAIHRRQDLGRLEDSFRFLREQTGVHVHADLIAGLPGETLESFAAGFDRLVGLGPQEIQVGLLKRLRGTPIGRHDAEWQMVYSPHPPYEILQNRLIDFATVQRVGRFARYWDLVGNSGRFVTVLPEFWSGGASPFAEFMRFSDWFYAREEKRHGIPLPHLVEQVFVWLTQGRGLPAESIAAAIYKDALRAGQAELPPAVKAHLPARAIAALSDQRTTSPRTTRRQARHRGVGSAPSSGPRPPAQT
jgi:B12 binding domain/Protein of unknown function (DUF4080)/Radical SAM superfamily